MARHGALAAGLPALLLLLVLVVGTTGVSSRQPRRGSGADDGAGAARPRPPSKRRCSCSATAATRRRSPPTPPGSTATTTTGSGWQTGSSRTTASATPAPCPSSVRGSAAQRRSSPPPFFWCPPASFCGHLLPCMLAQWGVSPAGLPDMRTSGQYDCSLGQLGTMRTLSRLLPAVDERDRVECSILLEEASVLACVRTQAHHNLTCRDISDRLRVNSGRAARGGRRPPALDPPARRQASRLHRGRR